MKEPRRGGERFRGTVRLVKEGDLPAIKAILEHWVRDIGTAITNVDAVEVLIMEIRKTNEAETGAHFLVAESDGRVVGVMGYRPPHIEALKQFIVPGSSCAELVCAYVEVSQGLGKGIGSALLRGLERMAVADDYEELIVTSGEAARDTAWAFYDAMFGKPIGYRVGKYGTQVPVWRKSIMRAT